jgi:hypothetical protein
VSFYGHLGTSFESYASLVKHSTEVECSEETSWKYNDEGRIATTPDILPPSYVLKLGQFCFEVPPEDDVKPNFRTPPMMFHVRQGAAAKDIYVFYFY